MEPEVTLLCSIPEKPLETMKSKDRLRSTLDLSSLNSGPISGEVSGLSSTGDGAGFGICAVFVETAGASSTGKGSGSTCSSGDMYLSAEQTGGWRPALG
jgi:hypothetical protein